MSDLEFVATPAAPAPSLEKTIADLGVELTDSFVRVQEELPGPPHGPQALARALGIDKVLASRLLKALRTKDAVATVFHMPGPEPLRRLLRAAGKKGASPEAVETASAAVDRLEHLIRVEAGDRSSLDAMITGWLPEARRDFELRRKQSVYKAMSQLKGMHADTTLATVLLHPSADGKSIDIVWISGYFGYQRLRPGVRVRLATRRMAETPGPRTPRDLEGRPIVDVDGGRLDAFLDAPAPDVEVRSVGESVRYFLGGTGFGPRSAVDFAFAEVNEREIARYVPAEARRKAHFFAEIAAPTRFLLFDVFVHEDLYPGSDPQIVIYDTTLEGVADVNDRTRDDDRLEMAESVRALGRGAAVARSTEVPRYVEMLRYAFGRLGWDDSAFRVHRCAITYPLYGTQVAMTFDPPAPPA